MLRLTLTTTSLALLTSCQHENSFREIDLVSDLGFARFSDPELVNPWGIVVDRQDNVWVANNGSGVITIYEFDGFPSQTLPAIDTGLPLTGAVLNIGSDFELIGTGGSDRAPAELIFASEDGALLGFTKQISTLTEIPFDQPTASYKGITLANSDSGARLFAADFVNQEVVIFDTTFTPIGTMGDPALPAGYGPFGIQRLGDRIYVAYAVVGDNGDEVKGAGLGIVSSFFLDGTFDRRVLTGDALNAPWGIARAPDGFGPFGGDLLVGNFGDGTIIAIDEGSDTVDGELRHTNGDVIVIDGLWGIAPLGGALFFAAGINDEANGLFGRIEED